MCWHLHSCFSKTLSTNTLYLSQNHYLLHYLFHLFCFLDSKSGLFWNTLAYLRSVPVRQLFQSLSRTVCDPSHPSCFVLPPPTFLSTTAPLLVPYVNERCSRGCLTKYFLCVYTSWCICSRCTVCVISFFYNIIFYSMHFIGFEPLYINLWEWDLER